MQLEGHVTGQDFGIRQSRIQNRHANFKRLKKPFFLHPQHIHHACAIGFKTRVSITHQCDKVGYQLVEERRLFAQLVAMTDGAANDAALHIATPFVRRVDAVADQECRSADVIGNHPQALVVQV